jgi:hypothetical protein
MAATAHRDRLAPHLFRATLALLLLSLAGACNKEAPKPPEGTTPATTPEAPAPPDVVAAPPAAPKVDLNQLETKLAAPAAGDALAALQELNQALESPGALPEGEAERAKELRLVAGFALLTRAAVGDGDLKAVGTALALASSSYGPAPALKEFAAQVGPESATGRAAALVAWLTTPPEQRRELPAPERESWRSFIRDDAPAGVAVRLATLDAVQKALANPAGAGAAPTPTQLAGAFGPLLCARCADVPEAAVDALTALLYHPANRGYVCEPAAEKVQGAAPWAYPEAVAGTCHPSDFGLTDPAEMSVLTAGNAIALRALALAVESRQEPKDEKNPLTATLRSEIRRSAERLDTLAMPLALPLLPVPFEHQAEQAAAVLPPTWLAVAGAERPAAPLETLVVDETGIAVALRPVAAIRQGAVVLEDRLAGYAFPGKQAIAAEAVAASDQKRDEEAKAAGTPVADPDVIAEVVQGVRDVQQRADVLAPRALVGAADEQLNQKRAEGQRTALLAVDTAAPAWLLRRALASLQAAGYRHPLVPRAVASDLRGEQVLPIVYKTDEGLPDTVAIRRYKRPIIVAVGKSAVDVYRPDGPRPKPSGEPPAAKTGGEPLTWPEGAIQTKDENDKIFSVRVKFPEDGSTVEPALAQTIRKMAEGLEVGNVIWVLGDSEAPAGRVLEAVDTIYALPGEPLTSAAALEPGLTCSAETCPTHIAVLFPDARRPRLGGPREPKPPKEPVATGPPGFCSKTNIEKVVTSRAGSFRFCYEAELQLNPTLSGRLTVQFTISRDGTVPTATILDSTIRNRKVEQCVLKTFHGMRFDKPTGGVCVVKWPLKFTN